MDRDVKNHIMNIMKSGVGGCKHQVMTQALNCSTCKTKMIRAQSEYNRLNREYPEKFIRKDPDEGFSRKVNNMGQQLEDRIATDKLYREHLKVLAFGRPEEKIKEMRKEQSGFYEKHTGDYRRKIL